MLGTRIYRQLSALGANAVVANILAGTDFEYPTGVSQVTVAAATGAGQAVNLRIQFGSRLVTDGMRCPIEATAGNGPVIPDNVLASAIVEPTERIQVGLTETAGAVGPTTTIVYVEVNPL